MTPRTALVAAGAAAALFGLAFSGFSNAVSQGDEAGESRDGDFTSAEEDRIRAIVEDYIRKNPDVLIDALNSFADSQRAASAKDSLPFLLSEEGAYTADPGGAKVAVVEFFDYHCGFCKRANGLVQDLTNGDEDVKVVFRELPILREESEAAAKIALAAREQGKYLDLHFALMSASGVIDEKRAYEIAEKQGLDVDRLKKDASAKRLDVGIERNQRAASELGVDGTPSFVVAGADGEFVRIVTGYRPDELTAAIKDAKKAAK
ncbi:MAG: DsbA family protein [Parvularculaceae bacterium]